MSKKNLPFAVGKSVKAVANEDDRLPEMLLIPAGDTEFNGIMHRLDADAAARVLRDFESQGRPTLCDWGHQSLDDPKSEASGWIERMRYEPGVGVVGSIAWLPEARQMIAAGKQRFISPVFGYEPDPPHRVRYIRSVALTNEPARGDLLVAKAMQEFRESSGAAAPPPSGIKSGESIMDWVTLLKELLEMPEATDEELAAALREKLTKKEDEGGDEAPSEETVEAVAVASKVFAVLKLQPSTDADTVETVLKSRLGASENATEQIASLNRKIEGLQVAEDQRAGETLFRSEAVETGKAHPDSDAGKTLLALACKQPSVFKDIIKSYPVITPPGRTQAPESGGGKKSDRTSVIASAAKKYDADGESICTRVEYVNSALRQAKRDKLTADESAKLE